MNQKTIMLLHAKYLMFCMMPPKMYVTLAWPRLLIILCLNALNIRIVVFPFKNKLNKLPANQMKNIDQDHLAYAAAEMINLVMYFNLVIGDIILSTNHACNII